MVFLKSKLLYGKSSRPNRQYVAFRFGAIRVVSSGKQHMPLENYSRSASFVTEETERDKQKPSITSKGPGATPISFDVVLDEALNVSPEKIYKTLTQYCESGAPRHLYRNGKLESKNKFILVDVSVSDVEMYRSGKIRSQVVSLSFKEYAGETTEEERKAAEKRSR